MAKIFYFEVDDFLRKAERYRILDNAKNISGIEWRQINPDKDHTWLTEGLQDDWEGMVPISNIENSIFSDYCIGAQTGRDTWAYNYNRIDLLSNMNRSIEFFNTQVVLVRNIINLDNIEAVVSNDDTKISWTSSLREYFKRKTFSDFNHKSIKISLYRPFSKQFLYYDKVWTHRRGHFYLYFPTPESEKENLVICLSGIGSSKPFHTLMVSFIPCLDMLEKTQCFPFYTYNEDGTGRKENITDWALNEYQKQYNDKAITKWDIFYYIYGVLHKPEYRTKYQANLRRSLPRIPFYEDFWKYSEAGKKLADLHVNYEQQQEYPLTKIEAKGKQLDYKVEKMKLSKDKKTIYYNDYLSLAGIPYEAFEYKLGNRSALEWIIDQYQIKTDKRSGIVNDPNRDDEPDYIIKLIGKIITVSLETVKIMREL